MTENNYFSSPYKFTDPIRYFKANDPIYWEVDNIPLKQLEENIKWVKDQVEGVTQSTSSVASEGGGIGRAQFSELRPYTNGVDNIVKVKAGKFSARINDAYDINPLQFITQTEGINENILNRWSVKTLADSDLRSTIEKFQDSAFFAGANGLIERVFTQEMATEDLPADVDSGGLSRVRYPGRSGYGWWRNLSSSSITVPYSLNSIVGRLFTHSTLESEFIKRWRGVTRTSIVNVAEELSIEIPSFDAQLHYYTDEQGVKQLLPATQRVDLLFIYSKPIDASSTTIRSFGSNTDTPKKITSPQLGLVLGAGVGVNFDRRNGNAAGFTTGTSPVTDDTVLTFPGTESTFQKILSHLGDESGPNLGFGTIKGSFPSPDDLMNLSPLLSENLESSDFRLVGQSILPVAYIVVRNTAALNSNGVPILNSEDVIDIRPFFRTTELTYNERAGIAAATPQISLANPVASEVYVDEKITRAIESISISTQSSQSTLLAVGQIMGGYDYGMEGSLSRVINKVHYNDSRDKVFLKDRVKTQLGYQREIPDLPEWDISEWVAVGNYSSKGSLPLDRINIHSRKQNNYLPVGQTPTWEDQVEWFYTVKKTIQIDAGSLEIPNSNYYDVDAKLLNCNSTAYNCELAINKEINKFTIIVKFEFKNGYQIPFASRERSYQFFELKDNILYTNFKLSDGRIKNSTFTYPTVAFSIYKISNSNPGLTTSLQGTNPIIVL